MYGITLEHQGCTPTSTSFGPDSVIRLKEPGLACRCGPNAVRFSPRWAGKTKVKRGT